MAQDKIQLMTQRAIYAAKLRRTVGRYAAQAYARKHGVSSLYRLACQLEAAQYVA